MSRIRYEDGIPSSDPVWPLTFKHIVDETKGKLYKTAKPDMVSVCPNCDRIIRVISPVNTTLPYDRIHCIVCCVPCRDMAFTPGNIRIYAMLERRPLNSIIKRTCHQCGNVTSVFVKQLLTDPCALCGDTKFTLEAVINHTKQKDNNRDNKIISIW